MAAVLQLPCWAVPGFMAGNRFRTTTPADHRIVATEVFAKYHGWSDSDADARRPSCRALGRPQPSGVLPGRYVRSANATGLIGVVVHRTGATCEVYLHT
ncbi:hypothetical protein [Streptomyces sp. Ru72]|uniref:hypothetical protein n=1 Tax=Streptomyces sp. Ru72 TaxID=2080747 RepID=UPI000CDE4C6A|nr:hypothetical protein [Streptomyces sp. Ru72]POX45630.1 hypothetical protein C3488_29015 [Streptomyces sp. Ru72]